MTLAEQLIGELQQARVFALAVSAQNSGYREEVRTQADKMLENLDDLIDQAETWDNE